MATGNKKTAGIVYGDTVTPQTIEELVRHFILINQDLDTKNIIKKHVFCVWGEAGVGKTETIESICAKHNLGYAYIAPAQFEEMGDFIGMPRIDTEANKTVYARPEWVPTLEKLLDVTINYDNSSDFPNGGILLIDDFNRAEPRILNGIMQLLQNYELSSWKMPKGWTIVLTANPEGGEYDVSPVDDALMGRICHVTMKFDYNSWIKWAETNNRVDFRFLMFCSKYKELVSKSCPRSLFKVAQLIAPIKDWRSSNSYLLLNALVQGTFAKTDREIAAEFLKYVKNNMIELLDPEEIVKGINVQKKFTDFLVACQGLSAGGINLMLNRLLQWIADNNENMTKEECGNIAEFLIIKDIPGDLRKTFVHEMNQNPKISKNKSTAILRHRTKNNTSVIEELGKSAGIERN